MPSTSNLDLVRGAGARLKRAKRLDPTVTARSVAIGELVQRVTLTVPELATLTGLHALTIRRAIAAGELKAANGGGRSHYRISRTDAEAWWQGRGGGSLLGEDTTPDTPQARATAILAGLDSDDPRTRNAAIVALASADAQTSELVEIEVEKSVAAYDGPEDDFSDWRALDGEPFHFPEEENAP